MAEIVETERIGRVLRITLNRPKVNAISRALSKALHAAASLLHTDPELRVGIITAQGDRVFCAGWDFVEATQGTGDAAAESGEGAGHGAGGFGGITQYWDLKKPLIAAVNGAAIGGGFEIALAADVILMSEDAYFELPEMQRGFLPDAGGVQRLPRRIPYNVAMEMILSGRRMPSSEALRWGLAHKVVSPGQLQEEALALATKIAEGAPLALQALKEVMQAIDGRSLPDAMAMTRIDTTRLPLLDRMWKSEDAKEGPRAFLEKRAPQWRGE
ncbi:MAG TPA: enoyl-CoA hydratase-related protein [Dongiaceae bacterium]|nr:enoyl-CoA hydratase-related protein [Dongiaceae bacterium]